MLKEMKEIAPLYEKHSFWDTQPVPKFLEIKEKGIVPGPLEEKEVKDVPTEPYALPDSFEWVVIDITKDIELNEVYDFLRDYYVGDSIGTYRFRYTPHFLRWALTPPDYHKDWIIGVRVKTNKKLVGFISGIPLKVSIKGTVVETAEIDFLCVHAKLRTKRLAPVLIKEVTRRVNMKGIWQAIYTAGKPIPTPIAYTKYYYRPINYKKLLDVTIVFIID
jgi:glycylpeptide N-tetradecanoyltransferase